MQEKYKISFVLFFLVLVLIGVVFFLLDRWAFFSFSNILQGIQITKTELLSSIKSDSISDLDFIEFEKKKEKFLIDQSVLKEERKVLEVLHQKIIQEKIDLYEQKKNLDFREKKLLYEKKTIKNRNEKIKDLAQKIQNMPPESVYAMLQHWNDFDIIDLFQQIDKNAEEEGSGSIIPYLLTLFLPERSAVLTEKMLLPESDN